MNQAPTITFEPVRNGEGLTFPTFAPGFIFLVDFPDLLHLIYNSRESKFKVIAFRDGRECTLMATDSTNDLTAWPVSRNGKTISMTDVNSNTGIFLTNKKGLLKVERVNAPVGAWMYLRDNASSYFIICKWNGDFSLVTAHSTQILLSWKRVVGVNPFSYFVNHNFVLCHAFEDSTKIVVHEIIDGAFIAKSEIYVPFRSYDIIPLENRFLFLIGNSALVIFDCVLMELVERYAFNLLLGTVTTVATRMAGDGTAEVFVSTRNEGNVYIHKTVVLHHALRSENCVEDIQQELTVQPMEQPEPNENTNIADLRQKYAALVEKNERADREIAETKQELEEMKSTVANLQTSLGRLEKKCKNFLLALAKK